MGHRAGIREKKALYVRPESDELFRDHGDMGCETVRWGLGHETSVSLSFRLPFVSQDNLTTSLPRHFIIRDTSVADNCEKGKNDFQGLRTVL